MTESVATVDTVAEQAQLCFHCGEECPDSPVAAEGKSFCCEGCRMVYEILQENGLCRYYDLEQRPGTSFKGQPERLGRFAYLDDPELQRQLLDFTDGSTGRIAFHLPQIHCISCVWLLENLGRLNRGVLASEVDFLRREIVLVLSLEEISLRQVAELLAALGYEPEITLDSARKGRDGQDGIPQDRRLIQKLGVAGFCFGNAMLFSLPEYFAGPDGLAAVWRTLFSTLKLLLSLPVLLYSGTDFLSSAWNSIRQRSITIDVPISLGMMALFSRSLVEILTGSGGGYIDSFTGFVFFLLVGRAFQRRSFASLAFDRDYRSYFPLAVAVREGNQVSSVPVSSLEVGRKILVRNGELIPADSRLLGTRCRVDYSYVTGESDAVDKAAGEVIYAGGRIVGPAVEMEVIKEVSQSYLTRLWNHRAFKKEKGSLTNAVSRYFTGAVLAIAALAALFWLRSDVNLAVNAFTSVLIIACPCALALSAPFATGTAINALARAGLFLKNAAVIERLARIDTLIFDKTGTLTSTRSTAVEFVGPSLNGNEARQLASVLQNSAHPLSRKILASVPAAPHAEAFDYAESPGEGLRGLVEGREVIVGSRRWLMKNGLPADALPAQPAGTTVLVAIGGSFRGYYRLSNAYRKGIEALLTGLRTRFRLFMLSGDNDRERERLLPLFGAGEELRFDQSPTDKLDFVRALQEQGDQVLMVGDGLNDAGALQQSAVGIAVAEETSSFSPACDGILDADRLTELPVFLRFARVSRRVVLASFGLSFLYNVVGLSFAVQGTLSPLISALLMPLSSVSIIAFTTATTRALARWMGVRR